MIRLAGALTIILVVVSVGPGCISEADGALCDDGFVCTSGYYCDRTASDERAAGRGRCRTGTEPASTDAGADAGVTLDGGTDGGFDGGTDGGPDGGTDGGVDAGPAVLESNGFGAPGPPRPTVSGLSVVDDGFAVQPRACTGDGGTSSYCVIGGLKW